MKYLAEYDENANAEARAMFERAVKLDPAYARARAYLALTIYVQEVLPQASLKEAVILDNYAAQHKHPNVRKWLARHPRWVFHFTPTSCSWLNAIEGSSRGSAGAA
jgi:hypothetical protein